MSKIAERLARQFKYDAETKRVLLAVRSGEDYDTLLDLLYEVAKEVDDDMAYSEVQDALYAIGADGLEDVKDSYYDYCTADIYTRDLLEWASKPRNAAWCDEAMSEGLTGDKGLVDILTAGQSIAKEFVWRTVIDLVREMEEERDE